MSFDNATFNSIYDNLIFKSNEEMGGSAKTAEDLIRLGWLLGQSSIALNHSTDTTCAIHEENLRNYQKCISENQPKPSINRNSCRKFSLNFDDFEQYLPVDCDNTKFSKQDIEELFLKTDDIIIPSNNKRPSTDTSSSNAPVKKFVFRQVSVGSTASSSTLPKTAISTISENQQAVFAPPQRNIQQRNERNYQPTSSSTPLFAFDRAKNSNESITIRDNSAFITAREELIRRQALTKVGQNPRPETTTPLFDYGKSTKTLGTRRSVHSKFIPPIGGSSIQDRKEDLPVAGDADIDPRLKNIEPKMIEMIQNEIMHQSSSVDWNDIAGLEYAKRTIQEAVIYPLLRPDIFRGLRGPPRGILLFGPPGTGKTLIGRCIASRSRSTFFSISASSLTSKWIGEGEKMVRALFAVASVNQPAVIFVDEIDSLLSQRSDTEHESSRRLKTEFLIQLDGARTTDEDRILIVGATNRPQELDEAARRRLTKRLYIPLPELDARIQILTLLLKKEPNQMSQNEIAEIGRLTDGFSGADMKTLCHEAMMGPIRSIRLEDMESIDVNDVPRVNFQDFTNALKRVRASVSSADLVQYEKWDSTYGLGAVGT